MPPCFITRVQAYRCTRMMHVTLCKSTHPFAQRCSHHPRWPTPVPATGAGHSHTHPPPRCNQPFRCISITFPQARVSKPPTAQFVTFSPINPPCVRKSTFIPIPIRPQAPNHSFALPPGILSSIPYTWLLRDRLLPPRGRCVSEWRSVPTCSCARIALLTPTLSLRPIALNLLSCFQKVVLQGSDHLSYEEATKLDKLEYALGIGTSSVNKFLGQDGVIGSISVRLHALCSQPQCSSPRSSPISNLVHHTLLTRNAK